jgi:hypothetical protein
MADALPSSIKLSPIQREVLDQIVHVLTSTQDPVWPERAILLWGDGVSDSTTARELDVSEETVRILRHRWFSWMARIAAAEKKVHKAFAEIVSLIFQILNEEIDPETTLTAPVGSAEAKRAGLEKSSELAALVAGIGYYRPDPRKQRTQSAKQQSATPIGGVSRFDMVGNQ